MMYRAMNRINGNSFEVDEQIEAKNLSEALDQYIEMISDNLRCFDAERTDDGRYPGEASYQYTADGENTTTLDIKVEEVEEEE